MLHRNKNSWDNELQNAQCENDIDVLAPYPEPSATQDKLVHRVEIFANGLKKISHGIKLAFYPISFVPSQIKKQMIKRNWLERAQAVPFDERIPPLQKAVFVANRTQAMDLNFFYMVERGRIWFKPIAAPEASTWLLFGPDGLPPTGKKIIAISSDGANLIAIDETEIVNYVKTNGINVIVTDEDWAIEDIKLAWRDRWLAIPIINRIMGLIREKHLKLPKDCIAFAISQKGPETGYYTDMSGKKQPEFLVGVTQLYALTKDGRIFFADPWLANGFWNEITAPEDGQFVAENMAAGASTIFLIRRDENGKPCMYTRFADFDSIGSDPLLPASYDPDNEIPLVRRLPGEDWMKQPEIPLTDKASVTSQISVLQLGRGQNNRQLRVEGTNANGEPGFYFKRIYEDKWHFEVTPDQTLERTIPPSHLVNPPPPPVDLDGQIFTKKINIPLQAVALKKFLHHGLNERGLHTEIEFSLNSGKKLIFPLYARLGLVHLLGHRTNSPYWKLILPKEYQQDEDPEVKQILKVLFKNKIKTSVSVNEFENGDIEIVSKHRRFKLEFSATISQKSQTSAPQPLRAFQHPIVTFAPDNNSKVNQTQASNYPRSETRETTSYYPHHHRLSLFSRKDKGSREYPEIAHIPEDRTGKRIFGRT